jgi:hypothetical protein
MKNSYFWDLMLCSLVKFRWCFRTTYHLHLQGRLFHAVFLLGLLFNSGDGGNIPPKCQLDFQQTIGPYIPDDRQSDTWNELKFDNILEQKTAQRKQQENADMRDIRKVASGELLKNKQWEKNLLYMKNILQILLNVVTARTEALVISGNKFLYPCVN